MRRQIEQAGRKLGRPRKHATNRERVAAQRRKAKEKELRLLANQFRLRVQDTNGEIGIKKAGGHVSKAV
jgi:hypothetical protein